MHERVLGLETSSRRCSVAVASAGQVVGTECIPAEARLTSEILPVIDRLVRSAGWQPHELDAVYFSSGPGSFTGLRVAATIARILHWATGCHVIDVPTLDVVVHNLVDPTLPPRAVAILDAKRNQVFGAAYARDANGAWHNTLDAALFDPPDLLRRITTPFVVVGEGIPYHLDACNASSGLIADQELWWPRAESVLSLGCKRAATGYSCPPPRILPHYLRRPEAEEVYEQRRGQARARRGE